MEGKHFGRRGFLGGLLGGGAVLAASETAKLFSPEEKGEDNPQFEVQPLDSSPEQQFQSYNDWVDVQPDAIRFIGSYRKSIQFNSDDGTLRVIDHKNKTHDFRFSAAETERLQLYISESGVLVFQKNLPDGSSESVLISREPLGGLSVATGSMPAPDNSDPGLERRF